MNNMITPSYKWKIVGAVIFLAVFLFGAYILFSNSKTPVNVQNNVQSQPARSGFMADNEPPVIFIANKEVRLEIADTDALRVQGLSGHAPLQKDQGMLFVFDKPGRQPIWMKDMLFSLDILWFNEKRELVHVVQSASPASYPKSIFYSDRDALYVLEVPENFVAENGIKLGDTFSFKQK